MAAVASNVKPTLSRLTLHLQSLAPPYLINRHSLVDATIHVTTYTIHALSIDTTIRASLHHGYFTMTFRSRVYSR